MASYGGQQAVVLTSTSLGFERASKATRTSPLLSTNWLPELVLAQLERAHRARRNSPHHR